MKPPIWLRKLVRPLIPDRVMAVVRLREHSRQVRVNVDVVVDGLRAQRRWLATTPDTYRVRPRASFAGEVPAEVEVVAVREPSPPERSDLLLPLSDHAVDAVVLGEAEPPRLVGRRRTEPVVAPVAVAVRREAFDEVGGAPGNPGDLVGLYERLRWAGRRLALIPLPVRGSAPTVRGDAITDVAGSAVVLGLVPMHDVGGGSRGAQLALELLRQGWHVTHTAAYGTAEATDLGIRFVHPELEQRRMPARPAPESPDELDVAALGSRVAVEPRLAIVEAPLPGYLEPARALRAGGWRVVYDLIDDWSAPSLGGEWYREDLERAHADAADTLVASAPDLVQRLERLTGREVTLVPNAVNAEVFGGDAGPEPGDLPPGDGPLFGYHGSLYGDWFDWDALREVAEAFADARVVVIGDDSHPHPAMPANVHFLGLKPQTDLPRYLHRLDVGLLPFKVTDVTHAVSPLKVYEYLACGVPVAAPPLRSLAGLDGVVTTAGPLADAVGKARAAGPIDAEAARAAHSWSARLWQLLGPSEAIPARAAAAVVVRREARHHPRGHRVMVELRPTGPRSAPQ